MVEVVEKSGFKRDIDVAKFSFALAVNRGCAPGTGYGRGYELERGQF